MRIGFKKIVLGLITLSYPLAWAGIDSGGPGDLTVYAACRGKDNQNNPIVFVIQGTAAPTFRQGLLTWDGDPGWAVESRCLQVNEPVAPTAPSAGAVLWRCSPVSKNSDSDRGTITVLLYRAGMSGLIQGQVTVSDGHSQLHLGSLVCFPK